MYVIHKGRQRGIKGLESLNDRHMVGANVVCPSPGVVATQWYNQPYCEVNSGIIVQRCLPVSSINPTVVNDRIMNRAENSDGLLCYLVCRIVTRTQSSDVVLFYAVANFLHLSLVDKVSNGSLRFFDVSLCLQQLQIAT
jgi:hypothetical protein